MEYLRLLKPEIFVEEPYDVFARLAAWLRSVFTRLPRGRRRVSRAKGRANGGPNGAPEPIDK